MVADIHVLFPALHAGGFGTSCKSSEKILSYLVDVPCGGKGNCMRHLSHWVCYFMVVLRRQPIIV